MIVRKFLFRPSPPPVALNAAGILLGENHRKVCDACRIGEGARVFTHFDSRHPLRELLVSPALAGAVMRPIPKPERRRR